MFIAHMPAGYLFAKYVNAKAKRSLPWKYIALAGLIGSVCPDFDLIYFYLFDSQQHLHHAYASHIPVYWLGAYLIAGLSCLVLGSKKLFVLTTVFVGGAFVHMVLDTITGGILWLYPFSTEYFSVVHIGPQFDWWVFNFVLHWTFILEVMIVTLAGIIFVFTDGEPVVQRLRRSIRNDSVPDKVVSGANK